LARKLLWIAFTWNDHNFEHPEKCAVDAARECGIETFEQANAWLESITPPKSASVPVERLESLGVGLLQEVVVSLRSCGTHFSLANDVERLSNQLAELIAEYKA
jgi:hypothetical protein